MCCVCFVFVCVCYHSIYSGHQSTHLGAVYVYVQLTMSGDWSLAEKYVQGHRCNVDRRTVGHSTSYYYY